MEPNQAQNTETQKFIDQAEHYGANNYHPLPIVISTAKGVWVKDPDGNKYMDMLSAYSALNHGHRHPVVLKALAAQAKKVTLTSRAFNNDQIGPFFKELCEFTGYDMVLPMNTGAEAVETAIKAVRKWGYKVKGVAEGKAEIIVVTNNFHGRTVTICSASTEPQYRDGFGPFTPGFKVVAYGNFEEFKAAVNPNTVAFMVEHRALFLALAGAKLAGSGIGALAEAAPGIGAVGGKMVGGAINALKGGNAFGMTAQYHLPPS